MSTRPRRRAGVLIALATVSLASFAFATTADARTPNPKPTVVLARRIRRLVGLRRGQRAPAQGAMSA
jgi:hypothetical protein